MNSLREPVSGLFSPGLNPARGWSDQKRSNWFRQAHMRARQVELSGLCGLALCVAFAMAPAPALATTLQQAWSVCVSMDSDAGDRVAECSAVIESGQVKGRQLAYAYVGRGMALDKLDNPAGAIADYGAALRLDPDNVSAHYSRALALTESNDHQNALADLDRAITLSPRIAQFYRDRARVLIDLNDYPRALADYDAAIALEPGDAYGFTVRGNAKLDSGNPAGALADYNEALRIKPDYAFARENRAYAYFNTGDYKRAVEELTFVIDDEPTARLHVRRGHAHAMLEDRDRELADYAQAIARDPGFIDAYRQRADAYLERREFDRAIADLSKVIELAPDEPRYWYARAAAYKLMNDMDKAAADENEAQLRERAKFKRLIGTR